MEIPGEMPPIAASRIFHTCTLAGRNYLIYRN
jgi:hypothetical protein